MESKKYDQEKLVSNITQDMLNRDYRINDFVLYKENYKNNDYFVAFTKDDRNDDFGSGDTYKYVTDSKTTLGFKEEFKRDGVDIAENGHLISHKDIYKSFTRKSLKESTKVTKNPNKAILMKKITPNGNKSFILAPSLSIAKSDSMFRKDKLKIVDWSVDVSNHRGYQENYSKKWKKQIDVNRHLEK